MKTSRRSILGILACAAALAAGGCAGPAPGHGEDAAHELVDQATLSIAAFDTSDQQPGLHESLRSACAVLVFPRIASVSFLVGGARGSGVLLVRDPGTGHWHGPAFYSIAEADVGAQVGIARRELLVVLRSCQPLARLYQGDATLRIGTSQAAAAAERDDGLEVSKDVRAFSRVDGLFVGAALDATVFRARPDLSRSYYGVEFSPTQILAPGRPDDDASRAIRTAIELAAN